MGSIKKLSKLLISLVAAGEVIERPVNVIKELAENSLDAKAKEILISLDNSGLDRIRVVDDGVGMSKKDLLISFLPHTTSKIYKKADLLDIRSLGFRGEALASISSVSRLSIKSKLKNNISAVQIELEEGRLISEETVGGNTGTTVTVSDLFYSTPARKKFMKSKRVELAHVVKYVGSLGLSYMDKKIQLFNDDKLIYDFDPSDTFEKRIQKVLGSNFAKNLIPIEKKADRLEVKGYLVKPQVSSFTTDLQYLFVNGRSIENRVVSKAVKDAYQTLLAPKEYPGFVLSIKLDPSLVDVNVHPKKMEVRFWNDKGAYSQVFDLISDVLTTANLIKVSSYSEEDLLGNPLSSYSFKYLKENINKWDVKSIAKDNLVQLEDTYIVTPYKGGLLLIDQHAAHESILFDQFTEEFKKDTSFLSLHSPVVLDLSPVESIFMREHLEDFSNLGFSIEEFGRNSFKLSSVPHLLSEHDHKKIVLEVLSYLRSTGRSKIDFLSKSTLAYLSCRSAIKAGERLSKKEMLKLVDKLGEPNMYYTCPHGRPVSVFLPLRDIEKLFKRR